MKTTQQRYDEIIQLIEERIQDRGYEKERKIAEWLLKEIGYEQRSIDNAFTFLMGKTLVQYIRERKMMRAYKYLLDRKDFDLENPIEISGYAEEASFCNAFKARFGITAKEAHTQKNHDLLKPPMTWAQLAKEVRSVETAKNVDASNKRFGLSKETYQRMKDADDLQALYEMSDAQSEVAFEIAEKYKIPAKYAFEFLDDFCIWLDSYWGIRNLDYHGLRKRVANSYELLYTSVNFELSVCQSFELTYEIHEADYSITDLPIELIDFYLKQDLHFKEFIKFYEEFIELDGEFFEGYYDARRRGCTPQEAVKEEVIDLDKEYELQQLEDAYYKDRGWLDWESE